MTAGIRVRWPRSFSQHGEEIGGDEAPDHLRSGNEIEYFCGFDLDCLDDLPELTKVQAVGQQDNLEREYVIDTRVEGNPPDGVRLVVSYDRERNAEAGVEVVPGTNTIVLHQESGTGSASGCPMSGPMASRWKASPGKRSMRRVSRSRKTSSGRSCGSGKPSSGTRFSPATATAAFSRARRQRKRSMRRT